MKRYLQFSRLCISLVDFPANEKKKINGRDTLQLAIGECNFRIKLQVSLCNIDK